MGAEQRCAEWSKSAVGSSVSTKLRATGVPSKRYSACELADICQNTNADERGGNRELEYESPRGAPAVAGRDHGEHDRGNDAEQEGHEQQGQIPSNERRNEPRIESQHPRPKVFGTRQARRPGSSRDQKQDGRNERQRQRKPVERDEVLDAHRSRKRDALDELQRISSFESTESHVE